MQIDASAERNPNVAGGLTAEALANSSAGGLLLGVTSTLAQTYTNRETMKIADNGLQTFGGHGFIREYPVEMWYRNARALTVSEGVVCL